jgi:hypothetical protein
MRNSTTAGSTRWHKPSAGVECRTNVGQSRSQLFGHSPAATPTPSLQLPTSKAIVASNLISRGEGFVHAALVLEAVAVALHFGFDETRSTRPDVLIRVASGGVNCGAARSMKRRFISACINPARPCIRPGRRRCPISCDMTYPSSRAGCRWNRSDASRTRPYKTYAMALPTVARPSTASPAATRAAIPPDRMCTCTAVGQEIGSTHNTSTPACS